MADLLRRPSATAGLVHDITPEAAGWGYVGFSLHRLAARDIAEGRLAERETILVMVEGTARILVGDLDFGEVGERARVFDGGPAHAVYVPPATPWRGEALTAATIAACSAPGGGKRRAQRLPLADRITRGKGTNRRHIHPIAMEELDVADSLLVTEVFTPAGHWSSYPPHRHDEADEPRMTYLEETYYHRLSPADGFGVQRVFTEDGTLDETMSVADHDVVLVPRGHHPCAAPYGIEMYYLNVMAGPVRRWRFRNHPAFDWIARRDAAE